MNEQLKALYDSFYKRQPSAQLVADIKRCHDTLIERLDKPERKLVLGIIDCKDQIAEDMSIDSFICGFYLAWELSNELNMYDKGYRDQRSNLDTLSAYNNEAYWAEVWYLSSALVKQERRSI